MVVGAAKIARDITERKRFEEALRDSSERLAQVIDVGALGVQAPVALGDEQ